MPLLEAMSMTMKPKTTRDLFRGGQCRAGLVRSAKCGHLLLNRVGDRAAPAALVADRDRPRGGRRFSSRKRTSFRPGPLPGGLHATEDPRIELAQACDQRLARAPSEVLFDQCVV